MLLLCGCRFCHCRQVVESRVAARNAGEMVSCWVWQAQPNFLVVSLISVKKTVVMETKDLHQEGEFSKNKHISDFFALKRIIC